MKSTRHGKELLSKSNQSTTTQGDSGIDNLTCLSRDDTKLGTDHTKADVYESSNDIVTSTVFESKDKPTQMTKQSFTIVDFITYRKSIHFELICKDVHN